MGCTAKCWTWVYCTECGRGKKPIGRSMPMESSNYCDNDCKGYLLDPQPPHLFSEHDSTRHYADPEGWAAHVAGCEACRGDE